jgi:ribonucleoside-diphosphate reductase alpha chain
MGESHLDNYQRFIAVSRYARWLPEKGRRETWPETVARYLDFFVERGQLKGEDVNRVYQAILNLEVMPSMRCLMTAGPALDRDNVAGYNCSYLPIDHPRAFDELLYILMCGTGVGFSVERQYVSSLPEVPEEFFDTDTTIVVPDSKKGWAKATRQLIAMLYAGEIPKWDLSRIRPAGSRLKTFGGRASGPAPLESLFSFAVELFKSAAGRKLSSLECHDLCCKIAEVVVVGGVRRSALISLSNPSDQRLTTAKHGRWWDDNPQRALSNNSACYTEKPEFEFFMDQMRELYASKSGERGVFNRRAAEKIAVSNGRREGGHEWGTNPCSEIILRPHQFCNLSEVVVREGDTLETLKEKVKVAAIVGTLQSTLTDFTYLRPVWKRNTEEEALLGVSLTGIMDNTLMVDLIDAPAMLDELKQTAIDTNKAWAKKLGVQQSAAITCVKPSGTVSQLVNAASGIHPRFSGHYIRTVRGDKKDPLSIYMKEAGFPCEDDKSNPNNFVFSFPVASPESSVTVDQVGAIAQLELWKMYQECWCEHKPSITVYYRDDEFFAVCQWMWENFDLISGISLLPYTEHTYEQAPYQQITEEEYEQMSDSMPEFDWNVLSEYEVEDNTVGSQELACVGGSCELP